MSMPPTPQRFRRVLAALAALPVVLAVAGCGGTSRAARDSSAGGKAAELRLGDLAKLTHDVALRTWLTGQGLKNSVTGGGDVTITPTPNSDIPNLFASGQLDGAWVPEPTASLLVLERGGHVLVNEKDLWPDGRFVTTHLIV